MIIIIDDNDVMLYVDKIHNKVCDSQLVLEDFHPFSVSCRFWYSSCASSRRCCFTENISFLAYI